MENAIQTRKRNRDKFVRYADGAQMYHVSVSTFMQGILMTMVDFRTVYAKDIFSKVKEVYGNTIGTYKAYIPMSVKAAETSAEGKSIFEHCGTGKVAIAYEALSKEVLHNED